MATVRDLIESSLRLIGAVASNETPTASELSDGLETLNDMLDSWSTESLLIPNKVREEFDLVPSQQIYTFGTGGNFNTARPLMIENAGLIVNNGDPFETPIRIFNKDEWARITLKSLSSELPQGIYPEDAYPLMNVNMWPIPSVAYKLATYSWKPLTSYSTVNDTLSLRPGYKKALRYNLAVELAPEFGRPISQTILNEAGKSKGNVERMNSRPIYLDVDPALQPFRRVFNIFTGNYE